MKHHATFHYSCILFLMIFAAFHIASAQTDFWQPSLLSQASLFSITFTKSGGVLFSLDGQIIASSTDEGQSWQQSPFFNSFFFFRLATGADGTIYGGGSSGMKRSTDDGQTWSDLPNAINYKTISEAVNTNGHIFIGVTTSPTSLGGIYRSTDQGQTWSKAKLGSVHRWTEVPSLYITPNSNILVSMYATGADRVYLSRNDGLNWRTISLPPSHDWWWVFGTDAGGNLLAAGGIKTTSGIVPTLYRSFNGGISWRKVHSFAGVSSITSIAATANGNMYVGTWNDGVYRSTDNGSSFSQINSGLLGAAIRNLAISPGGYLYALSEQNGVFRSQQPVGVIPSFSSSQFSNEHNAPDQFQLRQNYPNPFNPTTTIEFELATDALVTVNVYNTIGQEIATPANGEEFIQGTNELGFDGSNLPSGVYYYRIIARDIATGRVTFTNAKKMLLVK